MLTWPGWLNIRTRTLLYSLPLGSRLLPPPTASDRIGAGLLPEECRIPNTLPLGETLLSEAKSRTKSTHIYPTAYAQGGIDVALWTVSPEQGR